MGIVERYEPELRKKESVAAVLKQLRIHMPLFIISLALLAYLLGSTKTFVAYLIIGVLVLWMSHHLHKKAYPTYMVFYFFALSSMVFVIVYALFSDALGLLLSILFPFCLLLSVFLYFHHHGRTDKHIHNSFSKIFIATLYSHILSLAITAFVLVSLTHLIVGEAFVSISYLLLVWLLPVIFIYFFLTKFIYLHFFDTRHIVKEVMSGALHALIYSLSFLALMFIIYLLSAYQLVALESSETSDVVDDNIDMFFKFHYELAEMSFLFESTEFINSDIVRQTEEQKDLLLRELTAHAESDVNIKFSDYFTDAYMTKLSSRLLTTLKLSVKTQELVFFKSALINMYKNLKVADALALYPDGSKDLATYAFDTRDQVWVHFNYYYETPMLNKISHELSSDNFTAFFGDGTVLDLVLSYNQFETQSLVIPKSYLGKRVYFVLYHTKVFRDILRTVFDFGVYDIREQAEPFIIKHLYDQAVYNESSISSALRYSMIQQHLDTAFQG